MKIIGAIILAAITLAIWWYKAKYDPTIQKQLAKKKHDEELDKKKAELKAVLMEIDDVQKNLNDAINLGVNELVNILSARLVGLSARRDALNADIST